VCTTGQFFVRLIDMVARKSVFEVEKPTKAKAPRAKRLKINLSVLADAVVDGKLIVPIGGKVYFERTLNKVTKTHEGVIKGVTEKGIVEIWDETVNQFFGFSLHQQLPVIKAG
jgi:hypothetical protein